MKKLAIAILLSAGALFSVQAQAGPGAVIGAVDGALAGSYFGGAHGAVAGAIIGAAVGNSVDENRGYRYERGVRYGAYAPAPTYYAPAVTYQPSYPTYYEPRPVVYAPPVYESYPVYSSYLYPAPVYVGRYAAPHRVYYAPRYSYGHYGYSHYHRR